MDKLLIFPYNGNGIEAVDCISGRYELIGFIDDAEEKQGQQKDGFTVFSREALAKYPDAKILAVPGNSSNFTSRESIIRGFMLHESRFATVIHPGANISPMARIGCNVLIMAGVAVTSNAVVGNHVCVLPNSVVHHDSRIEDYCLIGANVTLAGHVRLHKNCYVGSGSSIIDNIEIGECTLIGLGANVLGSVAEHSVAVGNPARIIGQTK